MKRLGIFLFFIALTVSIFSGHIHSAEIQSNAEVLNFNKCTIMNIFYQLWKYSALVETERAIWIIRKPNGEYESKDWHRSPQRRIQFWKDPLPEHVVSVAHTHPDSVDPKPSKQDQVAAKQLGIAVYTVSRKGIWSVTRDGIITQEEPAEWFKRISENCEKQIIPNISSTLSHKCMGRAPELRFTIY